MSTAVSLSDVRSALMVFAHPDDVDFGAAGTVASRTAAGIKVSSCVATSGEASFAAVYPDARNPNAHPELLPDGPSTLRNHTVDGFDARHGAALARAEEFQVVDTR